MKVVAGLFFGATALEVHPERALQLETLASTPGMTWTAAPHSRFADKAPGASASLCGVKGDAKADVDAAIERGDIVRVSYDSNAEIPDTFDSIDNWPDCAKVIGDIRDQSNCGCCWAFGGVSAASDRMCITTKAEMMMPLSAQDVCFNSNSNGCGGGFISTPWDYIKGTGAVTGGQVQDSGPFAGGWCSAFSLPHCHHHGPQGEDPYPAEGDQGCPTQSSPAGPTSCDDSAKEEHSDFAGDKYWYEGNTVSAQGETNIQQAIMEGGPMEVAFTVYADFEDYAGGIYQHTTGGQVGGHAVRVVGWGVDNGVKYWKVANSWNPYWGEKGYFRIIRGTNEGGIENQALGSAPDATWHKGSAPSPPGPAPGPPAPPMPSFCGSHFDQASCEADDKALDGPCIFCPLFNACFSKTSLPSMCNSVAVEV